MRVLVQIKPAYQVSVPSEAVVSIMTHILSEQRHVIKSLSRACGQISKMDLIMHHIHIMRQ